MTPACQIVVDQLGKPLTGELLAHTQSCPECQQVQRAYDLLQGQEKSNAEGALPALPQRVANELGKRPRAYRWWWGPVALGAIYLLLVVAGIAAVRADQSLPWSLRLAGLGLGVASLIGFVAALAPRSPRSRIALFPVLGALLLGVVAAAPPSKYGEHFWADGVSCLMVEVLTSLIPLALGVWLLTRAAFHPVRSLLLTFCAATAGLVVLCFHCPDGLPAHLLAFHFLPWLAISGIALAARARAPNYSHAP